MMRGINLKKDHDMARVNGQQWLEKWGRRLNASGADIEAGVNRVTEAPGAKAAASAQLMLQRLQEAINNGTWARQVGKVTLDDWKTSMKNKAIPRIGQGVQSAQQRKVGIINATLQAVDQAAAAANALPKGNIEASIQRATTFMRRMSELAPKRTGATG